MSSESVSFGKNRPVYAAKQSYIQYADGDSGKWLLLVNIEASATAHHKELSTTIFEWVVENPCTKEDVVGWKTNKLRWGGSQRKPLRMRTPATRSLRLRLRMKSQSGRLSDGGLGASCIS